MRSLRTICSRRPSAARPRARPRPGVPRRRAAAAEAPDPWRRLALRVLSLTSASSGWWPRPVARPGPRCRTNFLAQYGGPGVGRDCTEQAPGARPPRRGLRTPRGSANRNVGAGWRAKTRCRGAATARAAACDPRGRRTRSATRFRGPTRVRAGLLLDVKPSRCPRSMVRETCLTAEPSPKLWNVPPCGAAGRGGCAAADNRDAVTSLLQVMLLNLHAEAVAAVSRAPSPAASCRGLDNSFYSAISDLF